MPVKNPLRTIKNIKKSKKIDLMGDDELGLDDDDEDEEDFEDEEEQTDEDEEP